MQPSHPQRVTYVAGASGTGTSTRAERVRRELTGAPDAPGCCVIATDVVRAQLRAVLDEHDHPDLWGESFNLAGRAGDRLRAGVNIEAFERQCVPILRAVAAGVEYALSEGWNVIVEGVHLLPGAFAIPIEVAVTVELLVVADPEQHVARFRSRDAASGGRRPAAHYEANLARVRAVQDELVDRWHAWSATLPNGVDLTLVGPDA